MGADNIAAQLLEVLSITTNGEEEPESSSSSSSANDRIKNLEKWNDELECQLLAASTGAKNKIATVDTNTGSSEATESTSITLKRAADILQSSILTTAIPSFTSDIKENSDSNDNDDHEAIQSVMQIVSFAEPNNDCTDLYLLSSLLRAAGLFMRWYAQVVVVSQQQQSAELNSDSFSNNVMTRLKCDGMLLLYSILLLMDIDCINMDNNIDGMTSGSSATTYPDVPRYASICIFRATYGNDTQSTIARQQFVNKLDGCHYLMKALLKGNQPVSRLFSLVRNVHHLIATCPNEAIAKMEKNLEELTISDDGDEGDNSNADEEKQTTVTYGLSEVLVTTLAWAYRVESDPSFPGVQSDRRSDLVLEILRALYVLGSTTTTNHQRKPSHATMTQIGIILCDLLQLSSADERVYNIKLAVVALLLNAPKEYSTYLVNNGGIEALVDILSYQTSLVVVERTGSSNEDAAAVVPILLVLLNLVQSNKIALDIVKNEVFPPSEEETFQQLATAEISKEQREGKVNAKNMAPLNAPKKGTLRWKLIRLMTWTESNVKRSACELLYALCDNDSTQFVLRTGFGNAIHFLGIRGQVNLPAGVDI